MIITMGMLVALCGYNTYVYLYNQLLRREAKQEFIARIETFKEEATRMRALAKTSHEKCPSQIHLELRLRTQLSNHIQIPAYPSLSGIYVYIHPEAFKMDNRGYFTSLSESELQQEIYPSHIESKKRTFNTTTAKTLSSTMPSLFIEALEQSLAYCGIDKNSNPLEINIVDKAQHANLEQEDALTIIVGVTLSTLNNYNNKLYTSQYIPRWKILPKTARTGGSVYGISSTNPTFKIHDFQVARLYDFISLLTPKDNAIKEWITNTWPKKERRNHIFGKSLRIGYRGQGIALKRPFTRTYNTHSHTVSKFQNRKFPKKRFKP